MYCPNCGTAGQTSKAYCKSCGEWLPNLDGKSRNTFGGETPQQMVITNLFMSAITTLTALCSALALYLTYLGTNEAKWSIYLAGAFCLCIAGWQASSFFVTLRLRQRLKSGREGMTPAKLYERKNVHSLNAGDMSAFVAVPSVTEDTTEILDKVPRTRDTQ